MNIIARFSSYLLISARRMTLCQGRHFGVLCGNMVCLTLFFFFFLTLSIPKTKLLVAGANLTADDVTPLELGGGSVEAVKESKYLGSLIEAHGGMTGEFNRRLPKFLVSFTVLCSWPMTLVWRLSD